MCWVLYEKVINSQLFILLHVCTDQLQYKIIARHDHLSHTQRHGHLSNRTLNLENEHHTIIAYTNDTTKS